MKTIYVNFSNNGYDEIRISEAIAGSKEFNEIRKSKQCNFWGLLKGDVVGVYYVPNLSEVILESGKNMELSFLASCKVISNMFRPLAIAGADRKVNLLSSGISSFAVCKYLVESISEHEFNWFHHIEASDWFFLNRHLLNSPFFIKGTFPNVVSYCDVSKKKTLELKKIVHSKIERLSDLCYKNVMKYSNCTQAVDEIDNIYALANPNIEISRLDHQFVSALLIKEKFSSENMKDYDLAESSSHFNSPFSFQCFDDFLGEELSLCRGVF